MIAWLWLLFAIVMFSMVVDAVRKNETIRIIANTLLMVVGVFGFLTNY